MALIVHLFMVNSTTKSRSFALRIICRPRCLHCMEVLVMKL